MIGGLGGDYPKPEKDRLGWSESGGGRLTRTLARERTPDISERGVLIRALNC